MCTSEQTQPASMVLGGTYHSLFFDSPLARLLGDYVFFERNGHLSANVSVVSTEKSKGHRMRNGHTLQQERKRKVRKSMCS